VLLEKNKNLLPTLVIIASLFYLIEGCIPRPLPWMKLGLANIITIVVIYYFDFSFLIKFILSRVIIGNLITGTLFTPSFFLSLSGSLSSAVFMFFLFKLLKKNISPIGISVAGASVHLLAQTYIVYLFLIHDKTILYALPIILLTALFTGLITGTISYRVVENLKEEFLDSPQKLNH
jgi:heptaprenyl diphosphate synthase